MLKLLKYTIVLILCLKLLLASNKTISIFLSESVLKNYIKVSHNGPKRADLLGRFLAAKTFENSEKINMMTIPEIRKILENPLPILEHATLKYINKSVLIGSQSCSLEKVAFLNHNPVPVCPWHWIMYHREDVFPFQRTNAVCNCNHCQAKTIYDSDLKKFASCQNQFVLMPCLSRESILNKTEKWSFYLEEVPVSCVCAIRLSPV